MIKLIVTASDKLYQTLSDKVRAEGQTPRRAHDVLRAFREAERLGGSPGGQSPGRQPREVQSRNQLSGVIVDMSLRAADTLLETLHSRQSTSSIPLVAVKCDGQTLPFALRRLCADVIEAGGDAPPREQAVGET
jgi:hypothetical protein